MPTMNSGFAEGSPKCLARSRNGCPKASNTDLWKSNCVRVE
ncbi:MAG TPA: hypothetical protein VGH71_00125 [Gammaproteobacteria bacterium]